MNGKTNISRLLEPIMIGQMKVKNRMAMAPMGTGFTTKDGLVTQRQIEYYQARARGGAGMIIVECSSVDFPRGIHASYRSVIDKDMTLPGLTKLAEGIKKHGARAIIQLNHAGRRSRSAITGFQPVAPSPIPMPTAAGPPAEVPVELTLEDISKIVSLFAQAAVRAKKAGFDGIEIHAAHDYLLAQFLSPISNHRQDIYGGSPENRSRFLVEVLKAIRASVGSNFPIWCRINAAEYGIQDGLSLDDGKAIARRVNDLVDAIHVSAVGYGDACHTTNPDNPGALLPLAKEIRRVVTVPVIAVGRLTPEVGGHAIENNEADIIAMGRELMADPEIPNKVSSGHLEDIRPCIACFYCLDVGIARNGNISCAVNGALGRENEYEIKPALNTRRIAVIGAGPAGMEATRVLSSRGHEVILFEKEERIGGMLTLAAIQPHKQRIQPLLDYFTTQLDKLDVDIRLGVRAYLEDIEGLDPDVVILATGAKPYLPQFPGIDHAHVTTAVDVLAGRSKTGPSVVIVGGGATGCETAEFLHDQGRKIVIVEMLPELASEMGINDRIRLMRRVDSLPITPYTNSRCVEIRPESVTVMDQKGQKQSIHADTVVLAMGMVPDNDLFLTLRNKGFETHLAGDCWHPADIFNAVSDGLRLGCTL